MIVTFVYLEFNCIIEMRVESDVLLVNKVRD